MKIKKVTTVDAYIEEFPPEVQALLRKMRNTILKVASDAQESISYGMPAYKTQGRPLVCFAAYKNHMVFTQHLLGMKLLKKNYQVSTRQGFGSIPLNEPLP
ncbi:DUF1801 domain-containing protein [Winogradskyella maritima]|nr:DUF1801 domain-containing protein [Winogradskyella maritima]